MREVSIEHLQRVRHANRGRLLLRTPGPVPFGICKCSFVETTETSSYITPPIHDPFPDLTSYRIWHHQFMTLSQIRLLTEYDITDYRFPWSICNGCGMPTGDAYSSGHLVLALLGLAFVLLVETSDILYRLDITPVCDIITGLNIIIQNLTFYQILVSLEHLQRVWHANRGRLLLRTPGPVPLWGLQVF